MSPRKIFVTGATGLLGSRIVDELLADGALVRALVLEGEAELALRRRGVDVVHGDLRQPASFEQAVRGSDCVIHAGARTGVRGTQASFDAVNVTGTLNLLRAARAAGVARFVHVSSVTVHGNDLRGVGDETSPLREEPNPYSRSKLTAERRLRVEIQNGAAVVVVRPGWIYGVGDAASFGRIVARVTAGRMPVIGSGRNILPLIDVRDAARGTVLAARAGAPDGVYVLVNDEEVTQRAYLAAIAAEAGVAPPRRAVPYGLALALGAAGEIVGRLGDNGPPVSRYGFQLLGGDNRYSLARARRELGFTPSISMRDGVREGVAWWRTTVGSNAA